MLRNVVLLTWADDVDDDHVAGVAAAEVHDVGVDDVAVSPAPDVVGPA